MAVAVSVLLFLIGAFWLIYTLAEREVLAFSLAAATIAAGVLNLALPIAGIHVMVGVMLCLYAVAAFVLFVYVVKEIGGGPNSGLGVLLSILSFLLLAWVTTFAVLQFTIVV